MVGLCVSRSIYIKSSLNSYNVSFKEAKNIFNREHFYVIDSNVYDKYKQLFTDIGDKVIILHVSEESKTYAAVLGIIDKLQLLGLRRESVLAGVGGGIVQDIVCFVASIYMRGIKWIFFPTTLLSQADSCIGSKSSINTQKIKNLLGTFYPPSHVYIDVNFLSTLNRVDIKSGVGEIIKIFHLFDHKSLLKLQSNYDLLIDAGKNIEEYIHQALILKKQIIELDEFDKKERLVMNYGHTFGHAIEKATNYHVPHGIAVTFGMDMANYLSYKFFKITQEKYKLYKKLLERNYSDYINIHLDFKSFLLALDGDKKNSRDTYNFIMYIDEHKIAKCSINKSEEVNRIMQDYIIETFNGS